MTYILPKQEKKMYVKTFINEELRVCKNSPFIEITLATTVCGEGDFKFMRVSTHSQSR